jgi:dsRNA-specific ribonuclease
VKTSNNKKAKSGKSGALNPQALMSMIQGGGKKPDIMKAMMMMMMGGQQSSSADQEDAKNPKQALQEQHSKALGKTIKAGEEIAYDTNQVDGDSKVVQYQSQVTISGQVFAGECAYSKKLAENNAAKTALNELYPGTALAPEKRKKGAKRKRESNENLHPKAQLMRLLTFHKNASATKDDLNVTVEESGGAFAATVSIPMLNGNFKGSGATRKEAEDAALQSAVSNKKIKAQLDKADAELVARKEAKMKASMAAFKEKHPDKFVKKAAAA